MSDLAIDCEWLSAGQDQAWLRETAGHLSIRLGDICLTRNEDTWSKTVRDSVLVSAYPLAMWLAASWWRLSYEPLPKHGESPVLDWRMSHEMGAANSGFVWPFVVMASDGEVIQVWALPSQASSQQSVRYLTPLSTARTVSLQDFQRAVGGFIEKVVSRLDSVGCVDTDLATLWNLVNGDRADSDIEKTRRLEALMGYDPEECPVQVMAETLELERRLGVSALSELVPIFGQRGNGAALGDISRLAEADGLLGKPDPNILCLSGDLLNQPPWRRAVEAAKSLRAKLGSASGPLDNDSLYGSVGLQTGRVEEWVSPPGHRVGLAVPGAQGSIKFVPRKRHPVAKRFEFARFLGDYINGEPERWLASTDLPTWRQKFQRAFAAEFLCPIASLVEYLGGDYTESAIEEAAANFNVSEKTVESLLANNGYTPRFDEAGLPYRIAPRAEAWQSA